MSHIQEPSPCPKAPCTWQQVVETPGQAVVTCLGSFSPTTDTPMGPWFPSPGWHLMAGGSHLPQVPGCGPHQPSDCPAATGGPQVGGHRGPGWQMCMVLPGSSLCAAQNTAPSPQASLQRPQTPARRARSGDPPRPATQWKGGVSRPPAGDAAGGARPPDARPSPDRRPSPARPHLDHWASSAPSLRASSAGGCIGRGRRGRGVSGAPLAPGRPTGQRRPSPRVSPSGASVRRAPRTCRPRTATAAGGRGAQLRSPPRSRPSGRPGLAGPRAGGTLAPPGFGPAALASGTSRALRCRPRKDGARAGLRRRGAWLHRAAGRGTCVPCAQPAGAGVLRSWGCGGFRWEGLLPPERAADSGGNPFLKQTSLGRWAPPCPWTSPRKLGSQCSTRGLSPSRRPSGEFMMRHSGNESD